MSKEKEKRERQVITAQGQLDAAPSKGKAYLKLPPNVKMFVPEKNKTYRLVFLPWKAGKHNSTGKPGSWVTNRFIYVHPRIGPAEETHICPARAFGKPCAVCEFFVKLRSQGADWEKIRELRPKDRDLYLVHDINGEKKNLLLWDESVYLFGDAFRQKYKKKPAWLAYADLEEGCMIEVEGKEKKIGKSSCTDFSTGIEIEVREDSLPDWLIKAAETLCVDDWVVETPYSKLKKLFDQTTGAKDDEDEDDEDEDEDEDEDDEDEDEDEDDEDEESEKPAPKKPTVKKPAKKEPEPEEDEDEPEEDEEEPEEDESEEPEEPEEEGEPEEKPAPKKPGRKPKK